MYRRILLLCDLEGVNKVVGVPYEGLRLDTEQWEIARRQAPLELNAAADALFRAGAESVGLWDNHGRGRNIEEADLDPRIVREYPQGPRLRFAEGKYDCVFFFGYHCMEGTLGGVLAHTMNSTTVQYYRIGGEYAGEVDIDATIAGALGIPCRFFAGGNIACGQAKRAVPDILTVVTKTELSRNSALFRDNEELLSEIGEKAVEAACTEGRAKPAVFPCVFEKSFKRVEDAAVYFDRLRGLGISPEYPADPVLGRDAHTVRSVARDLDGFIACI
ncbi:MAG: M55 family metallopeptidase [Clostridia bacterium]|nr:M55 family metallopeptidase [Clostridia bacterium]